jgi:hypothetical protein
MAVGNFRLACGGSGQEPFVIIRSAKSACVRRSLTTGNLALTVMVRGWRHGSVATPTSTSVIRQPSCGSNPWVLWRKNAGIDRCSTSIMFWNRITGQSSVGCAQASHFRSFWAAWRTIACYEAIYMIRKGEACGSVGLLPHFMLGLFAATN